MYQEESSRFAHGRCFAACPSHFEAPAADRPSSGLPTGKRPGKKDGDLAFIDIHTVACTKGACFFLVFAFDCCEWERTSYL
jgi:hypothetical protein